MTAPSIDAVSGLVVELRADRDQWRELARLEAENARKAEARMAALESTAREKDEARTALANRLGGYAITEEYDFPGDVPEFCGFWCNECREHVEADGAGHQKTCLCHGVAPMTPRAKQSRSALSKGEPQ